MLSVQTNMLAWNAGRQFKINTKKQAKSTEKLSSGYRINRAADDAAGLSISEKMRRQIRGLKQGSDNVQEGISLVQVADGALDEVVDMLQRINELSVKAYNGTNTKEDRKYIQAEVTQLIKEIERIADTTTFNEIQVLKGNPTHVETIEAGKEYTGFVEETINKEIPDWLKSGIDEKLEMHSYTGLTQDTTGKMFVAQHFDTDGTPIDGVYYGPDEGQLGIYTWAGAWNPTLDDNPTAKISFSGLTNYEDAAALYTGMVDLLGSAVGIPCGTCVREYYGIGFSGIVDGYSAIPDDYVDGMGNKVKIEKDIDISLWKGFTNDAGEAVNCFDKIKELMKNQMQDTTLNEAQKKAQVKNLAEEIAQKLCAKTYETMASVTKYNDHFDRALTDGVYDIIVYDYRDRDKLSALNASEAPVVTSNTADVRIPASFLEPGTEVSIQSPLWIVCSAESGDWIPLELPLINTETMGISGYDVARYKENVIYSDAYQKKLDAWENDYHIENKIIPAKTETVTYTSIKVTPFFDSNGEMKLNYKKESLTRLEHTPESSYPVKVYNNPKPIPKEGDIIRAISYEPDSNRLISDALDYVLSCRTMLGTQQNRLEHTYNNNQNKLENTTASESRIRDTDIAEEMVAHSNHNILLQAGTSMLSQANQYPELIMQLLR